MTMKTKAKAAAEENTAPKWPGAKLWALEKIKPYPNNARTHPPAQIEMLASLLRKFGPDQPIVVDESGVIIKGHGRRLAALSAGMRTFPIVQHVGIADDDKRAMRISDNQASLLAGWDQGLLKIELHELKLAQYDMPLLGFGDVQLVEFMTGPQAPAEFGAVDERTMPTEYRCPNCGWAWSGNPKPGVHNPEDEDDSVQVRMQDGDSGGGQPREAENVRKRASVQKQAAPGSRKARQQKHADK